MSTERIRHTPGEIIVAIGYMTKEIVTMVPGMVVAIGQILREGTRESAQRKRQKEEKCYEWAINQYQNGACLSDIEEVLRNTKDVPTAPLSMRSNSTAVSTKET